MSDRPSPASDRHCVTLRQVSVFLSNSPGKLAEVVGPLARAGINLRALSIAEAEDYGILRMIADDPDKALAVLEQLGVTTKVIEVLGVEVPDRPGGLADLLTLFDGENINIHYMYAEIAGPDSGGWLGAGGANEKALMIMKVEPLDAARRIITRTGIYS